MSPDTEFYLMALTLVGRADGDRAADTRAKLSHVDRSKSILKFWAQADLQVAAILGDRAESNRRAAAIDAQPAGPFVLAVITAYCLCGAPFDLEFTPNFKARLAESGLPWPPQSAMPFMTNDRVGKEGAQ
jgi:adenylate cyclase